MSQAPTFLPRSTSVLVNETLHVSTGLTLSETQAVPHEQLLGLRQSMGLPLQGGVSTVIGYSNTFFRVRPEDVTDALLEQYPPVNVDGGGGGGDGGGEPLPPTIPTFRRGDIVVYKDLSVDSRQWVVTDVRPLTVAQDEWVVRIVSLSGAEDIRENVPEELLDFSPGKEALESRLNDLLAGQSAVRDELAGRISGAEGALRGEVADVRQEVQGVPTATVQQVGPLVAEQGDKVVGQLAELISGVEIPDLGDLLALVPSLASFLVDPLEFVLAQGGGVSQEVIDSVRPR